MDSVYVVGHKNPDTDSIVSAMAYAALQNALGGNQYIPACCGHLNTEYMCQFFYSLYCIAIFQSLGDGKDTQVGRIL